ncbi:MAG: C45 family peptidase [Methanoregula sp.]|nr:C45 family peptidase [Methanoregula sp.]
MLILLCMITGTAAALTLPQGLSFSQPAVTGVKPVASFEGGQRFAAGDYPVIVLSGSYRQMGRQYGGLMKTELNEEYAFLLDTLIKRGYTQQQVRESGRDIPAFYPQRIKEIFLGMSETSGLTPDDIAVLYYGAIFQLMATPPVPASCSYLATWGNYTTDGSVIVSRNWDLDDSVTPYTKWYVLAVYRPTDGSNSIATWSPAGMRPETFMNSKGLFIADDNSGLNDAAPETRPEFITEYFRFMLDYSDLKGLDAGIRGANTDVAWIVDVAGPDGASVYEKMTNKTRQRGGEGVIAAANHFVDPAWNLSAPPEHSLSRYNNLLRQAGEAKGSIDAQKMMQIRDVCLENGGAKFCHSELFGNKYSSNHQVVFMPKSKTLWMKTMDKDWQKVELGSLFGR